jgi:hypothetical protein
MLMWMWVALMLASALSAMLVKIRAHLLALYLWHKTRDLNVLREVARFERRIR